MNLCISASYALMHSAFVFSAEFCTKMDRKTRNSSGLLGAPRVSLHQTAMSVWRPWVQGRILPLNIRSSRESGEFLSLSAWEKRQWSASAWQSISWILLDAEPMWPVKQRRSKASYSASQGVSETMESLQKLKQWLVYRSHAFGRRVQKAPTNQNGHKATRQVFRKSLLQESIQCEALGSWYRTWDHLKHW